MPDLIDIITEVIKNKKGQLTRYAHVTYDNLDLIIIRKGEYVNYVNLTKLVIIINKILGTNKRFNNWKMTKSFQNIMENLINEHKKSSTNIPVNENFLIEPKGLSNELKGTYGHPDLLTDLMVWMDPLYAGKVGKVMRQYEINKILEEKDKLIQEQKILIEAKEAKLEKKSIRVKEQKEIIEKSDKLIKKKQCKIDDLNSKVDILMNQNKDLMKKNEEQLKIMRRVDANVVSLQTKNKKLHKKIKEICNDRVVKRYNKEDHMMVIIKRNVPYIDQTEDYYEYCAIRCMEKVLDKTLSKQQAKYPDLEIICVIDYTPNAINLWSHIRDKLNKNKIECKNTSFNIVNDLYEEEDLIQDITKIHDRRLKVLNRKNK